MMPWPPATFISHHHQHHLNAMRQPNQVAACPNLPNTGWLHRPPTCNQPAFKINNPQHAKSDAVIITWSGISGCDWKKWWKSMKIYENLATKNKLQRIRAFSLTWVIAPRQLKPKALQVKASASERKIRKRDNDGRWIYDDLYRIHKNHKVLQVVSQVASSWVVRPPWCSVICLRINCISLSETVEICGIQVVLHVLGIFWSALSQYFSHI